MTNADIFRKAAAYIREHGWATRTLGIDGGPRCLLGAIGSAGGWTAVGDKGFNVPDGEIPATRALLLRLGERLEKSEIADHRDMYAAIAEWNDYSAKGAEEVIALLDGLSFDEDLKAAAQSPLPADIHSECEEPANREYAEVNS